MLGRHGSNVPSKREPTTTRRRCKIPAGARASRSVPPGTVDDLKRLTFHACEQEYERRWGENWLARSGASSWFVRMWEAEEMRRATEDEARRLYERARRAAQRGTLPDLKAEILEFVRRTPAGAGGMAAMALLALAEALAHDWAPPLLEPLSELEQRYSALGVEGMAGGYGFAALVRTLFRESPRPPIQDDNLSSRDAAVIAILCGAAPNWHVYTRSDGPLSPARVIEDVARNIRKIVGRSAG
jgi:hypothetical protein